MTINPRTRADFSPYAAYPREDWATLRADMPMPLSDAELENLSGLIERVSGPRAFPRLHDYQERLAQKTFDLLTRWVGTALRPGGWLALQVPGNLSDPLHTLLRDLATSPRWADPAATCRALLTRPSSWQMDRPWLSAPGLLDPPPRYIV